MKNINEAKKIIKENDSLLRESINKWLKEQDVIAEKLKQSIVEKYIEFNLENTKLEFKDLVIEAKKFEVFKDKKIAEAVNLIIQLNENNIKKNKSLLSSISGLGLTIEESYKKNLMLGTKGKSKQYILDSLNDVSNSVLEKSDEIQEKVLGNLRDMAKEQLAKINVKNSKDMDIKSHIEFLCTVEKFTKTVSENFSEENEKIEVAKQKLLNKEDAYLNDYIINLNNIKNMEKIIRLLQKSVVTQSEINKYEKDFPAVEQDNFKRSSLARGGVSISFNDFKRSFKDYINSNSDEHSMLRMYLGDIEDHTKLSKACLKNDVVKMSEILDCDTSSRDLVDTKLYDYLQSEEFDKELESAQKKSKSKKLK